MLAVSVNPADWRRLRGTPLIARASFGPRRPKNRILGGDIAGVVEAVGGDVTGFKPGDAVYANLLDHGLGGFAEYVAVPVEALALKPANLSFEEAAAVPMAGMTALQGLRYHGELGAKQRVLINGASGGVGHFAVQIARAFGAEVTGVTSTKNDDFVCSLGADHVIDYTAEDFTRTGRTWDRILDAIGNRTASDLRRALAPGGACAVSGFTTVGGLLDVLLRGGRQISVLSVHTSAGDLALLREWIEAGWLRPTIDRHYPFKQLPDALRYLESGHARGKVVLGVSALP